MLKLNSNVLLECMLLDRYNVKSKHCIAFQALNEEYVQCNQCYHNGQYTPTLAMLCIFHWICCELVANLTFTSTCEQTYSQCTVKYSNFCILDVCFFSSLLGCNWHVCNSKKQEDFCK
jgi:hypothetical protein